LPCFFLLCAHHKSKAGPAKPNWNNALSVDAGWIPTCHENDNAVSWQEHNISVFAKAKESRFLDGHLSFVDSAEKPFVKDVIQLTDRLGIC
jgi:hypothetical protein